MPIPTLLPPPKPSSNVLGIGYDKTERRLYIEFLSTGIYRYEDVPEKAYTKLLEAPSIGRYISKDITPNFYYAKIKKDENSATDNINNNHTSTEGC